MIQMNDLVSIVVPVYNIVKYLPECIKSILEQTYNNIEIILVDDGSTDASGELCNEYAQKYNNIKAIHRKNGGLGFARNTGIENATGKYVAFVDGDDFIGENHIKNLILNIVGSNSDASYGGYCQQVGEAYIPKENPLSGEIYEGDDIRNVFLPHLCGKLKYNITDEVQMSVCMGIYSLELINKYKIRFHSEKELISEDLIFNIDFLEKASKVCINKSCEYYYRNTEGSLSKIFRTDRLEKQTIFLKYVIERTKKMGIFEKCEQRIYSTYLAWVRAIIQGEQQAYKRIGIKDSISNIRTICSNPSVIDICRKYDESNLTFKLKVMHKLIKWRQSVLLWILSYIKNNL